MSVINDVEKCKFSIFCVAGACVATMYIRLVYTAGRVHFGGGGGGGGAFELVCPPWFALIHVL